MDFKAGPTGGRQPSRLLQQAAFALKTRILLLPPISGATRFWWKQESTLEGHYKNTPSKHSTPLEEGIMVALMIA